MTDIKEVLEERGKRYGEFSDHASVTQSIKTALLLGSSYQKLTPYMREALEMVAHKMGRIVNGDPYYDDSWIDIVGYAQLVVDELKKPVEEDYDPYSDPAIDNSYYLYMHRTNKSDTVCNCNSCYILKENTSRQIETGQAIPPEFNSLALRDKNDTGC